jgi:hypothetical protein
MGLFGFLGTVLTLPVKVVALPLRVVEVAAEPNPDKRVVTKTVRAVTNTVEEAMEDLDQ